jgi:hypothetical protein
MQKTILPETHDCLKLYLLVKIIVLSFEYFQEIIPCGNQLQPKNQVFICSNSPGDKRALKNDYNNAVPHQSHPQEDTMQKIYSFLTGAVIGGLVGAAMALLLAPYSGDELRLEMQERAQRFQGEIKGAADARRAELERQLSALRAPRRSIMDE